MLKRKKKTEGIYVKKLKIFLTSNGNDFGKLPCLLFSSIFAPRNRVMAAPNRFVEEEETLTFCVKKKKGGQWTLPCQRDLLKVGAGDSFFEAEAERNGRSKWRVDDVRMR